MTAEQVIIQPVLSEKTNDMREAGKYVFKVHAGANKLQIQEAVKAIFDVNPVACNIINVARKPKRQRNAAGYTSTWKKAIVTLKAGEKIEIFEGA